MKKRNRIILLIICGLIIVAVFGWYYLFHQSQSSVASKKPDFKIEGKDLLADFEHDEAAANTKYLDKIVLVTGTVESKSSDSTGIMIYLKEADSISGVICSFEKDEINPDNIMKGKRVSIKGICAGYLMDVVLNKCSLEPDSSLQDDFQPQTSGFVNYLASTKFLNSLY